MIVTWRVSSKTCPELDRSDTEGSYASAYFEAVACIMRIEGREGCLPRDILIEVGRELK